MTEERINYLIRKYAANTASGDEVEELFEWIKLHGDNKELQMELEDLALKAYPDQRYSPEYWEPFIQEVLQTSKTPVRTISRKWWRYAAAATILICIGAGAYVWKSSRKAERLLVDVHQQLPSNDVMQGKEGAVLTLADGSSVVLDNRDNGIVTTQGNTKVLIRNGRLVYDVAANQKEVLYNTMTTPNGREYRMILPDGSQVWLNAASSITYPTAFDGKDRTVAITGEAYFEVFKDQSKPFHVKVNDMDVRVLGTHFNINSYANEAAIKTTLLEGSVQVLRNGQTSLLKPGQQAVASRREFEVVENVDMGKVMAWKNGLFNFDHASLEAVMRELARWYDMDVKYEGEIPTRTFRGKITRDLSLMQVLGTLDDVGVKFRIEGKTIVVTN